MKELSDKERISSQFKKLQDFICDQLEAIDGEKFHEDLWERDEGGGGRTRILNGNIIEKGGVNFSEVYGQVSDAMKKNLGIDAESFFATGVSIVLHPHSVHIPIIHMNVRYFELNTGKYWFGGGIDLTPHYIVKAQARDFHTELKGICDKYNIEFYPKFKKWADDYFFIPHRNETRGVGGIFYDHLNEDCGLSKNELIQFAIDLGEAFPELYRYQIEKGVQIPETETQKKWQAIRRGRYVEFNLVNDRGTKFGLVSGGRTESILMSMPPIANWEYMFNIQNGSQEELTQQLLVKGVDWL